MKIIVDENIAFAEEAFSNFGEVQLIGGRKISNLVLKDADILIVRSITKVDEELLNGTPVKFVGTATIGTDHVDISYLNKEGIYFADAKGCNADSVVEYFLAALLKISIDKQINLNNKSIGIIGVGNVGSRVLKLSEAFGLKVLKNDPPRERAGDGTGYVSLEAALEADIVTFHVPHIKTGIDRTYHLLDSERIKNLKTKTILINTSRGSVIDNTSLLNNLKEKDLNVCLDVWEGEPDINIELLKKILIGTPHIAGYSLEGKVNGTKLIFNALCKFLNEEYEWRPKLPEITDNHFELGSKAETKYALCSLIKNIYNIETDDNNLRKTFTLDDAERPEYFDKLRKEYHFRREFTNYNIMMNRGNTDFKEFLHTLRFNVREKK